MSKVTITFKPKQTTKKLLKDIQDRAQYVLTHRFGLEGDGMKRTLESIGQEYGITRERVRQIEKFALQAIRKSDSFEEAQEVFDELRDLILSLGGVVEEEHFLELVSKDPVIRNHVNFYLALSEEHFSYKKEDKHFKGRWVVSEEIADKVHAALQDIHDVLKKHDLISEDELIEKVRCHNGICEIEEVHQNDENARRWLRISKKMDKNPLGEWGKSDSPNVKTRGIRDYAYLVMRKHGSPMHFREVAASIEETFDRPTHVATTHNELIKDSRFVLVGRGVYALKEWGYKGGVVREVIQDIIEKEGPMSKEDIVDRVLKERYLKRNTILVNLQNPKHFKKDSTGLYFLADK